MAQYDRFMIAPINTGLQTDVRPWIIPDDAFAELNNAYIFRGRLRKRFGSQFMNGLSGLNIAQLGSRLRLQIGTTDANGDLSVSVPGTVYAIGQMFSVGADIFTVYQTNGATYSTNNTASATYDTATGQVVITNADPTTDVYFYPALPVMGLLTYETGPINQQPVIGFDTQFAYEYTNFGWEQLGSQAWTGDDTQFFWGTTYQGLTADESYFFVSNFNAADGLYYWDGTTWTAFAPSLDGTDTLITARMLVQFKDRLLAINTVEGAGNDAYVNRCRFSANGSALATNAWRQDIPGQGGWIDAPTQETAVGCEFIKDRLLVFFDHSTWELVYTGNNVLPFRWQKINTELGCESTFSTVPFDKVVLSVGDVGVHACNGVNVERIDDKIPDEVYQIHDVGDGIYRVYGIRDFFVEHAYWTFPSKDSVPYPNKVLVYNYKTGAWAFNDDTIMCFGYYRLQSIQTWQRSPELWLQSAQLWNSGTMQSNFRQIIAGNHQGFVFIVDTNETRNAPSLQITNIQVPSPGLIDFTIINHNLVNDQYIYVEYTGTACDGKVFRIGVTDQNTVYAFDKSISSVTYAGGGTAALVSQIDIKTKQYNFYVSEGRNAYIQKVDFYVDKTSDGQITVDYSTNASDLSLLLDAKLGNIALGNGILETSPYVTVPYETVMDQLWHPVYLQADGELIQLRLYFSDEQMRTPAIAFSDFQLHAMTFYATRTSSRLQ